jgi:hypothetical protein
VLFAGLFNCWLQLSEATEAITGRIVVQKHKTFRSSTIVLARASFYPHGPRRLLTHSNSSPHGQAGHSYYIPLAFARGRTGSVSSSVSDSGSKGKDISTPGCTLPHPLHCLRFRSESESPGFLAANPNQWTPAHARAPSP